MLLGLNLRLCKALGFLLFKRCKNPPVIKMLEGGSELHTPHTGPGAGGKRKQLSSHALKRADSNAKFN